ncbi:hypothetical protein NC652_001347 [Populus alba x Populus x berolinensis]|uniref:Uncharacterized protein n=3 Tax=Populus TaxID=3689 RepID=A0ACC4CZU8_POPAL|nr:uncharacterized protein LOC118035997 [Populus alba]KAG6791855.1 hypothetical protein POTOM_000989 [Populus tomentosa]KAJ6962663.1 hypothetical protein NC652_001347 [Populus alba x Populus x berolinensis]TKR91153.1 hypothetical protein D5086_0000226640 [Populus alba]
MASGWVKSLQCKSRAFDDVFNPNPKHLLPSSSCKKTSSKIIKDVIIETKTKKPKPKRHPINQNQQKPKPELVSTPPTLSRSARNPDPVFPVLAELPEGHPSRNVVEIIFHTSWSNKSFPGRIEMIFKVQNGPRTVARFEEYRESVKTRAGLSGGTTWEENARCVADGNEMMRFYCLGPAGGVQDARGAAWVFPGGKGAVVCTFSGSGGAHESAGAGRGRRAMLVCRVVAGRVTKQIGFDSLIDDCRVGFDSVSGDNGELMVFDSRAVLPCFLIIYRL